jgi:hypothetical protein
VKLTWYEGARDGQRNLPPSDLLDGKTPSSSGSLLIGERGSIFSPSDYGSDQMLLPEKQFEGKQPPSLSEEQKRAQGREIDQNHKGEWVRAIQEGKPEVAWSNFNYAGTLTEAMLLGNVAVRLGKPIDYDPDTGQVRNNSDAAKYVRFEYRKGWTL